jgi:hypothetical protein
VRIPASAAPFLRTVLSGGTAAWPLLDAATTERLLAALDAHGALPLLYAATRGGLAVDVPVDARFRLRAAYMAAGAHNAVLLETIGALSDALEAAGARALLLKGAALLALGYENPALRPMVDVDLLVAEPELAAAAAAVVSLGFQEVASDAGDRLHHAAFVGRASADTPVLVELHRRLFLSPPLDRGLPPSALLARARPAMLADRRVLVPDAVDMLLHLAGHLVLQHARGERLVWVSDIDRAVRVGEGEPGFWRTVAERGAASGLATATADALVAARHWFGTPIDGEALTALRRAGDAEIHARLRHRPGVGREGARLWSDVQGIPGLRARIRFALGGAFPAPDAMRAWYGVRHAWQLPPLYVRRVVRGLGHLIAARIDPARDLPLAAEPPERWMVER